MLVSCLAGVGSAMLLLCPDKVLGKMPVEHTAKHAPKSSTVSTPKPVTALHRHRLPKDEVVNVSTTRHANNRSGGIMRVETAPYGIHSLLLEEAAKYLNNKLILNAGFKYVMSNMWYGRYPENSQVGQNLTAPLPHFSASYIIRFR
ncbi:hypothetical protein JK193_03890 [Gluconobacter wancherniae]|nr:hypothetical protein [Gluconobacter wancherniae]